MLSAMNLVAWAALPFGVRDLVRGLYLLLGHRLIQAPGLSGLIGSEASAAALFAGQLLALVDVYLIWHLALLVIGVRAQSDPGRGRAWASVGITQAVALLLQVLPAYLVGRLASLTIARPFLF
jgi:energy-converting hydrogenase Eha subunit B